MTKKTKDKPKSTQHYRWGFTWFISDQSMGSSFDRDGGRLSDSYKAWFLEDKKWQGDYTNHAASCAEQIKGLLSSGYLFSFGAGPGSEGTTRAFFKKDCDYVFQLERGAESGRFHFQGMFTIKGKDDKKSKGQLLNYFEEHLFRKSSVLLKTEGLTLYPTRDGESLKKYVTKSDTYISPHRYTNVILYREDDISLFNSDKNIYEWQSHVLDCIDRTLSGHSVSREINFIYDPKGNNGKSTFTKYLMVKKGAVMLPISANVDRLMAYACQQGPRQVYILDIPRALLSARRRDKQGNVIDPMLNLQIELFSSLEMLKNGVSTTSLWGGTKSETLIMDPPYIVVFSNTMINPKLLSMDRWSCYQINSETKCMSDMSLYEMYAAYDIGVDGDPAQEYTTDGYPIYAPHY